MGADKNTQTQADLFKTANISNIHHEDTKGTKLDPGF